MPSRRLTRELTDYTTEHAEKVNAGKFPAGPHVRAACARHLSDLKRDDNRVYFDVEAADRAIRFFEVVLKLNGGEFEGDPFVLLEWQKFIIGSIFGWKKTKDDYRRFRTAYIETGKGSGKSPLAAGVGLYGLVADNEPRAEIYAAATKKDQAMILFRDAVAMVDQSPALSSRLRKSGTGERTWNLGYLATNSFFRSIASDGAQSGPRPHIALLDEIHEHPNGQIVEFMRAGTKGRRQALMFMITNSGADRNSICWEYHDYGAKVAEGSIQDDSFFSYVCALDEGDDPFDNADCWPKVNPSLGITIQNEYLEEQIREARGMPSKEAIVRRLNFCQWTDAANPWISYDVWKNCEDNAPVNLQGRSCFGGLDLSSTTDLTALALVFAPSDADPYWRLLTYAWLPGDGINEKSKNDRVPYTAWEKSGELLTTPGKAINKLAILEKIAELNALYSIESIAFDRWRIEDLNILIEQNDYLTPPLIPFGQGFQSMAPAIDEFERLIIENAIRHNGNKVLQFCAANAVAVTDPAGNKKLSKSKSTGRIDLMVAATMAVGISVARADYFNSFLDDALSL